MWHDSDDVAGRRDDGTAGSVIRISDVTPAMLRAYMAQGQGQRAGVVAELLQAFGSAIVRAVRGGGRRLDAPQADCRGLVEHELKTPLTSIRSAAEILRDNKELSASERNRFLGAMLEDSKRLERFIDGLLAAMPRGEVKGRRLSDHTA